MIYYNSILASHYRTNTCGCTKSRIPCTAFCVCNYDDSCMNPMKIVTNKVEDDDDTEIEDEDL